MAQEWDDGTHRILNLSERIPLGDDLDWWTSPPTTAGSR
jgi:hypothetical protein